LASGSILRLWRAGWDVVVAELLQPRAVRRKAAFAQAVIDGQTRVEEATAYRVGDMEEARQVLARRGIPVVVDPDASIRHEFEPQVLLDGRMRKQPPDLGMESAVLTLGLGPGFVAGENCHAVIETIRGPFLGRVIWQGSAEPDTGIPEQISGHQAERVLRAPAAGVIEPFADIGALLKQGDLVASVSGLPVTAAFDSVLRGLVVEGLVVEAGEKIGDIDPRADPRLCFLVSDKALAVGGGVVEAILSIPALRPYLWA
jgi:xanthine dehydrogenase accessory factor